MIETLAIRLLAQASEAPGFDLLQLAQQSPFVVVAFALLWILKVIFEDRKLYRSEHAELAAMTLKVITDNTAAQRELSTAVHALAERVERLEERRSAQREDK